MGIFRHNESAAVMGIERYFASHLIDSLTHAAYAVGGRGNGVPFGQAVPIIGNQNGNSIVIMRKLESDAS